MAVEFNHTLVWCQDKQHSARFLTDILGLPAPEPFGHFLVVKLTNGVSLDFCESDDTIAPQHYAFLIGDDDFDQAFGRIRERGLEFWADPRRQQPGEINHLYGGRGVYFKDPDGHFLEMTTRPYGSAP